MRMLPATFGAVASVYPMCPITSPELLFSGHRYVVRHVLASCEAGEDLSQLGFAARKMKSPKGYVPGVTGLTSKPEFFTFSSWRD